MKTIINGNKVKLYFSENKDGIDVCVDHTGCSKPYVCRFNYDGTMTLYNDVSDVFEKESSDNHIDVYKEFD